MSTKGTVEELRGCNGSSTKLLGFKEKLLALIPLRKQEANPEPSARDAQLLHSPPH